MEFHTLFLYAFISLEMVIGTFAYNNSPSEVYWQSALPTTPMPKALLNLLHTTGEDAYVGVGKDVFSLSNEDYGDNIKYYYPSRGDTDLQSGVRSFFREAELHEGATVKLRFLKTIYKAKFLPRQVAESIPFSTTKLPQILTHFSVETNSLEAEKIKKTLRRCEVPAVRGEDKYCATSLESLVDYGVSKLGKDREVFATEVEEEAPQVYTTGNILKRIGDKSVVCHRINYLYAVFYCHEIHSTKAYRVELKQLVGGVDNAITQVKTLLLSFVIVIRPLGTLTMSLFRRLR